MAPKLTDALLRELSYDLPADPVEATRLADDVIRLAEITPEDFPHIRRTRWFRDLWRCLGTHHLPTIGLACASVVQARDLLIEVVRALVLDAPEGRTLLLRLEEALNFRRDRPGGLGRGLVNLQSKMLGLKTHLETQGKFEANERKLPDEQRMLLIRAMIAAAWADEEISAAEIRLLTQKILSLELSPDAAEGILKEIESPLPLEEALEHIEQEEFRHLLYRNLTAVALADGRITLKENLFLAHFAQVLRIPNDVAAQTEQELFYLYSRGGLDALVRIVGGTPESDPLEARPPLQDQEDPSHRPVSITRATHGGVSSAEALHRDGEPAKLHFLADQNGPGVKQVLAEARELWSRLLLSVSEQFSWTIAKNLMSRLDAVARSPDLDSALQILSPREAKVQLLEELATITIQWCNWFDATVAEALPELLDTPELTWNATGYPILEKELASTLGPVLETMEDAHQAGKDLRESKKDPLEFLRTHGTLHLIESKQTGMRRLFVVPPHKTLEAEEKKLVKTYTDSLTAILQSAEILRREVGERIFACGRAYFDSVIAPTLIGKIRAGLDPRITLAVLARRGNEFQSPSPN